MRNADEVASGRVLADSRPGCLGEEKSATAAAAALLVVGEGADGLRVVEVYEERREHAADRLSDDVTRDLGPGLVCEFGSVSN